MLANIEKEEKRSLFPNCIINEVEWNKTNPIRTPIKKKRNGYIKRLGIELYFSAYLFGLPRSLSHISEYKVASCEW